MHVEWAIACRYVEVNDNLATIVGAGIDNMYVPALPANVQVIVATRLMAEPDELTTHPHTLRCVAFGPDTLDELARAEGQLQPVESVQVRNPGWLVSLHMPMVIVFPAETEGAYRIEVSADDTEVYRLPMHIHEGGQAAPPPPPEDE